VILIDTHALLWFLSGDAALSSPARRAIEDNERVCVSIASLWEIAIKIGAGKLTIARGFDGLVADLLDNDIEVLSLEVRHLGHLLSLPLHHRDPFDRVIIAQAIAGGLQIVTKDVQFAAYEVELLW